MTLSHSLTIAVGAGIAGVALGLIMAGGVSAGQARADTAAQAELAAAQPSTGAYMIVMGTVYDREAFMSRYASQLAPLYARHGGAYVAVTGDVETLEGDTPFESVVMSRWPDKESARAFWNDPDYRALADLRIENEWGDFNVVLVPAIPQQASGE
ncbi:MAG: DUF1330 domain-containing protein [Oceanicaulis sp.]